MINHEEPQFISRLSAITERDVNTLVEKGRAYGDSWKKRGGVGAFMMAARKWDRLENIVFGYGYDIFAAVRGEALLADEPLLDTIRDLRAYLLLIEDEVTRPQDFQGAGPGE